MGDNLNLAQFLIPAICSGILFMGMLLALYIFYRSRIQLFLALFFLSLIGFIFCGSEVLVLGFGSWLRNFFLAVQFHRIEQLAAVLLFFALPFYFSKWLNLDFRLRKLSLIISLTGLGLLLINLLVAFIFPDLFIDIEGQKYQITGNIMDFGRGQEGLFYRIRDLLFIILTAYLLILLITDLLKKQAFGTIIFKIIVLALFLFLAFLDVYHVYTARYLLLGNIAFSRFSLGFALLVFLLLSYSIKRFIEASLDLEEANQRMDQSEMLFRELTRNIKSVFWIIDRSSGNIEYISPVFEEIWGSKSQELKNNKELWKEIIIEEDKPLIDEALKSNWDKALELEFRIKDKEGNLRWIRDRFFPIAKQKNKVARISEDFTQRKKAEEKLIYLAYHDELTGLHNRKAYYQFLENSLLEAERLGDEISKAVLILDLDNFRTINETSGPEVGDKLLQMVVKRVRVLLRKSDFIFRIGSDEFAILLNNVHSEGDAAMVAGKVLKELDELFLIDTLSIHTSASIGISLFPKDSRDPLEITRFAALALNEAKENNNTFFFYHKEMNAKLAERIRIDTEIRLATKRNEFQVYFQPLYDEEFKICGMETLVRWFHAELGPIAPDKFIHIAEANGCIFSIGEYVLRSACNAVYQLNQEFKKKLRCTVNVSPYQFRQGRFVPLIKNILDESGLDPSLLELEITEGSIMQDPVASREKMQQLGDMGVRFAIDDFGTGYSSLSYLKFFPISHIKIDRSFISEIPESQENKKIVRAIVALSQSLGLEIIAEGIETELQRDFLRGIGTMEYQGAYFSMPLSIDELKTLIAKDQ